MNARTIFFELRPGGQIISAKFMKNLRGCSWIVGSKPQSLTYQGDPFPKKLVGFALEFSSCYNLVNSIYII